MIRLLPSAAQPLLAAAQHGPADGSPAATDPVSQAVVAAVIVGLFVLLALEKAHRVLVALGGVAILWAVTYLTPYRIVTLESAQASLDLNVLLLLAAMMAVVGVLKTTGVFGWAVSRLLERAGGRPRTVVRLIVWFTGTISAVADNVTTVIFVTPMAARMAAPLGVRPIVFLLPMVMAANIGGTATLIGDPPNIMIGSGAGLSFLDFVVALALPCAVMMIVMEWWAERTFGGELSGATRRLANERRPTPAAGAPLADGLTRAAASVEAPGDAPVGELTAEMRAPGTAIVDPLLLRWALWISALVFVGFVTHSFTGMPAAVPAMLGAAALLVVQDVLYLRRQRPTERERKHGLLAVIEHEIEWPTLIFFAFLFIIVGAAVSTGLIDRAAAGLVWAVNAGSAALGLSVAGTLCFAALLICWTAAIVSAFVDNIPFVAVTIPIVAGLRGELAGDTTVLWWALSLGACLGGNATVIGASANVTTVGLAERAGAHISFREFSRFGVPVTVLTLLIASAYLALRVFAGTPTALGTSAAVLALLLLVRFARRGRRAALAGSEA